MTYGVDVRALPGGTVALRGIAKKWGSRTALSDVTFSFEPGRIYVISGPSGTGKTTLLNVIAGYVQPDAGTVEARTVDSVAQVGYLFQDDILFSGLTARQNVYLRAAVRGAYDELDATTDSCLSAVGMLDRAEDKAAVLSGGERQRVQLATVLAGEPDVVLLDEPTASLDPHARRQIAALVRQVFDGTTRIIVSHDEQLAGDIGAVDQLVLEGGRLRHA